MTVPAQDKDSFAAWDGKILAKKGFYSFLFPAQVVKTLCYLFLRHISTQFFIWYLTGFSGLAASHHPSPLPKHVYLYSPSGKPSLP